MEQAEAELSVEAVCQRLGLTARTLHYYEEIGLISPKSRTSGGHRLYDEKVVGKLEQIVRLKNHLGYSLNEIRHMLDVESRLDQIRLNADNACLSEEIRRSELEEAADMLHSTLSQIQLKMQNLQNMKNRYEEKLRMTEKALETKKYTFISQKGSE
ncbi:MerR family transcriptional regulator [Alicyclobacillus sp. TC]|uniref:helix-turn-helix domain-containing protein n=1 Tax=Alicyclobacillus sp. TC TaxID=2606450 RepID=UPI001EE42984|nr:MerR family transcriptional regulator [Alicyclobacillus sp. TC]